MAPMIFNNAPRQFGQWSKEMKTERAAGVFGMKLQSLDVVDGRDVESAFGAARKLRADALVVLRGPLPYC
jgi:hypothetical protein